MIEYLALKRFPGSRKSYDDEVHSICQECSVGCGFVAYLEQSRIVDIQGEEDHPVSRGRLCARGLAFGSLLTSDARLQKTTYRQSPRHDPEEFESWETGLNLLAERLKRSRDTHGPESLLVGCDPEAGLDFYYAALRFSELWGTPNVFNPLDDPDSVILRSFPKKPCYEWPNNQCILVVGADPASTHPIAFGWIMEAQKNGAKIVSVDNHFTATMSKADFSLILRPEKENLLGMALMKFILNDENCKRELVPEKLLKFVDGIDLADLTESIGVSNSKIEELARLIVKTAPIQIVTSKKMAYSNGYGIWITMVDAMGLSGLKGGGWYPLDSGRPFIDVAKDIRSSGKSDLSSKISHHSEIKKLLERAAANQETPVRSLICTGNCIDDYFSPIEPLLNKLETIAYFGAFQNATSRLSNFTFPAALWPERDNLFFTDDRGIWWAKHVVSPSRNFRSGLDFWIGLADRLGFGEYFPWRTDQNQADHEAFRDWVLSQSPETSSCNSNLLESEKSTTTLITWPCVGESVKDLLSASPLLDVTEDESLLSFSPTESLNDTPAYADSYPLYLEAPSVVSRSVVPDFQSIGAGKSDASYDLQLNPETANTLEINTGDTVYVQGRRKIVEAVAWISRSTPRWMVYSNRPIGETRVLVYRKGASSETALSILKKMLTNR